MSKQSINNPEVADVFRSYPPKIRQRVLVLRKLIFATARNTTGVGEIEETLRWGQPTYLTSQSKSGSMVRIDWKASAPSEYAICFHCQTNLIETFRQWFPGTFEFDGNRRIVFGESDPVPTKELAVCIAAALNYHLRKKSQRN